MVDPARPSPAAGFYAGGTGPVRGHFRDRIAGHEIPSPGFIWRGRPGGHFGAAALPRHCRWSANCGPDWLRLRQAMLAAPKKSKIHLELMVSSFSSFAAVFRHVLIAMGETPAANKREAIEQIAPVCRRGSRGFSDDSRFPGRKREAQEIDVEKTLDQYFAFVEAVTDKFDRWLDTKSQAR